MPAKKKATTKTATKVKVKHLTNALYWSIKMQQQVRTILLTLDPDKVLAIKLLLGDELSGPNDPRVFRCPPAK